MAKLDILVYPDPRLRRRARAVTEFDHALAQLAADMAETMYAANGIGLAAVQVNVPARVVVMDLSAQHDQLRVFVNPQVRNAEGRAESEEGCLSVPGVYATVPRAKTVTIEAQNLRGERFEIAADELLSICIQHEIDHLDGKVFVDYLSRMKQSRIRKKLAKERQAAVADGGAADAAAQPSDTDAVTAKAAAAARTPNATPQTPDADAANAKSVTAAAAKPAGTAARPSGAAVL
ncbi:MAG: peptide deformylase [bacterium]